MCLGSWNPTSTPPGKKEEKRIGKQVCQVFGDGPSNGGAVQLSSSGSRDPESWSSVACEGPSATQNRPLVSYQSQSTLNPAHVMGHSHSALPRVRSLAPLPNQQWFPRGHFWDPLGELGFQPLSIQPILVGGSFPSSYNLYICTDYSVRENIILCSLCAAKRSRVIMRAPLRHIRPVRPSWRETGALYGVLRKYAQMPGLC